MISRSTLSGATRTAIAMATARIAMLKKITTFLMFEYVKTKIKKFNKFYYVFLEHTLQKF
jgi:hypothetical protein